MTASYSTSSSPLVGTVPYHLSYILLHSHKPISQFPSKIQSPLRNALQLNVGKEIGHVNFSWSADQPVHKMSARISEDQSQGEVYCATAFSATRGRLFLPEVSLDNLENTVRQLKEHASESITKTTESSTNQLQIYVCTHGARDCRCGESGGEVAEAMRRLIEGRGLSGKVTIGEVAHVGGHKYVSISQ